MKRKRQEKRLAGNPFALKKIHFNGMERFIDERGNNRSVPMIKPIRPRYACTHSEMGLIKHFSSARKLRGYRTYRNSSLRDVSRNDIKFLPRRE